MASSNPQLPPKPSAPQPSDCCGTGCCPCVHDIYEQDIKAWKRACQLIKDGSPEHDNQTKAIRKDVYTDFEIIDVTKVSENVFLYKFLIPNNGSLGMTIGQHLVLQEIKNNRTISRQYTPISEVDCRGYFEVLIKIYPKGKITQIVKDWKIKDQIKWRGPFGNFIYTQNKFSTLFMLAAGTGIAPLYQIIKSIVTSDDEETKIVLFYSSKSAENILLRKELHDLTSYWNFNLHHFLSNDSSTKNKSNYYKENINLHKLTKEVVKIELDNVTVNTYQVLICGTKSFEKDMINACKDKEVPDDQVFKF